MTACDARGSGVLAAAGGRGVASGRDAEAAWSGSGLGLVVEGSASLRGASGVRAAAPGVHCGAAGSISSVVVMAIFAKPNLGRKATELHQIAAPAPQNPDPKDTSVDSTPSTRRHAAVSVADAKIG